MPSQHDSNWPAWKIALAVGVPVAIGGVGYYIYKKNSGSAVVSEHVSSEYNVRKDPEGSSSPQQKPMVEVDFQIATAKKNEGNAAFKQGKYAEAIEKYTEAISVCPSDKKQELSTYHQNKAAAYEKLGNNEGVVTECTKAIEFNPRYIKALTRRSRALETLGRKSECLEDMTAVCIMEQFQNQASMFYADKVLKDLGKELAQERFRTRKPMMPSALFVKQYFASFTEDVISQPLTDDEKQILTSGYIRAKLAFEEGNLEQVITECTAEISLADSPQEDNLKEKDSMTSPTSDESPKYLDAALVLRGTLHLLQGNAAKAQSDFDRVIYMDTADIKLRANALIKRGSLFMQEQKPSQAQDDFNYAVKLDPQNTDVLHHRGQLNILLDKTSEALQDFEACMTIKPDFALAHAQHCYSVYRQAFTRSDMLGMEKAMAKFEELIEKSPKCSETYGLYAQALSDQGKLQKADEMFQKAIEVEPDNATQYVHRGLLCLQWKQDLEQGVKLVQQAIDIDEKCDFAHETMGTIEVQRGNMEKAIKHFEMAINLAKSEMEMAHLFSLKVAAVAQANLAKKYGMQPSGFASA